jgi:hypothetical protein
MTKCQCRFEGCRHPGCLCCPSRGGTTVGFEKGSQEDEFVMKIQQLELLADMALCDTCWWRVGTTGRCTGVC